MIVRAIYQCVWCNRNYKLSELLGTPGKTKYYYCSCGTYKFYDISGRLCAIQFETGRVELIDKMRPRLQLIGSVGIAQHPFVPHIIFATWKGEVT